MNKKIKDILNYFLESFYYFLSTNLEIHVVLIFSSSLSRKIYFSKNPEAAKVDINILII